ncbi:uncharacterized protein LOC126824952 [Patella vulgata]|uniref:uncharacterized protein LOC126824952 n=1 Tax=Patella vulgata TaxID=6465 RepID=UPI00217FBC18|nr:uncharacterized protein LOC126824952 [Patella vulgata]
MDNRSLFYVLTICVAGVWCIPPPLPGDFDLQNQTLHAQPRVATSFKYRYVANTGYIAKSKPGYAHVTVAATSRCSDTALEKAALAVSLMVRHMAPDVFSGLTRSHGLGIFTKAESMSAYPENAHLADTAACRGTCSGSCSHTCTFDGRKFSSIAGLSNSRSVVLDDNVLCDRSDPYGHSENIAIHEFGHLVMSYMPRTWSNKIKAAYTHEKYSNLWKPGVYGTADAQEYWAEATEAFFSATVRTDVTGGLNMCGTSHPCSTEQQARAYLKRHDPQLFEVLSYAYTNNHPEIASGGKPCL